MRRKLKTIVLALTVVGALSIPAGGRSSAGTQIYTLTVRGTQVGTVELEGSAFHYTPDGANAEDGEQSPNIVMNAHGEFGSGGGFSIRIGGVTYDGITGYRDGSGWAGTLSRAVPSFARVASAPSPDDDTYTASLPPEP